MSQYWQAYVMHQTYRKLKGKDDKEYIAAVAQTMSFSPNVFGSGRKLMEHSYLGNEMTETVVGLICDAYWNPPEMGVPEAKFKGFQIAWAGDFTSVNDLLDHGMTPDKWKIFSSGRALMSADPSFFVPDFYKDALDEKGTPRFEPILICDERREYLDITRYRVAAVDIRIQYGRMKGHEKELIPHPLPILCAASNRKSGGDYEGTSMDEVGSWAFRYIRAVYSLNEVPKGYKDLSEHPFEEKFLC